MGCLSTGLEDAPALVVETRPWPHLKRHAALAIDLEIEIASAPKSHLLYQETRRISTKDLFNRLYKLGAITVTIEFVRGQLFLARTSSDEKVGAACKGLSRLNHSPLALHVEGDLTHLTRPSAVVDRPHSSKSKGYADRIVKPSPVPSIECLAPLRTRFLHFLSDAVKLLDVSLVGLVNLNARLDALVGNGGRRRDDRGW